MHNDTWPTGISHPATLGRYPFHYIVRSPDVHNAHDALIQSNRYFGDAFHDCQDLFEPPAWRLLRYSMPIRWALLADERFDPRQDLATLAASTADQGVPAEWLNADPGDTAAGIRQSVSDCDIDAAKASWVLLSYIQSIRLDPARVLDLRWWEQRTWLELLAPR